MGWYCAGDVYVNGFVMMVMVMVVKEMVMVMLLLHTSHEWSHYVRQEHRRYKGELIGELKCLRVKQCLEDIGTLMYKTPLNIAISISIPIPMCV